MRKRKIQNTKAAPLTTLKRNLGSDPRHYPPIPDSDTWHHLKAIHGPTYNPLKWWVETYGEKTVKQLIERHEELIKKGKRWKKLFDLDSE